MCVTLDFPRTSEGRVYHLGLKYGEIANRIVSTSAFVLCARLHLPLFSPYTTFQLTVGDPARALGLSKFFDPLPHSDNILRVESERGFLTFTGTYKGVRLSIVSIGMGVSNIAPLGMPFAPLTF